MATKVRLEVKPNVLQSTETLVAATDSIAPVNVVKETAGPVTVLDKVKGYYHTVITVVAAVLVLLNEVTPVTDFLPATAKHWVSVVIITLTALANFLKSNEHWVDDL